MPRLTVAVSVSLLALLLATAASARVVVYKHDQYPDGIDAAATAIIGASLAPHPGFAQGEAFGQIYHPEPGSYPIRIQAVDVVAAGPPNGGHGTAHGEIEIWAVDGAGPGPSGTDPLFVLSTHDVLNPSTLQFGMPLKGGSAISYEFDWEDPSGHPPAIGSGSFAVVFRYSVPAVDLQTEWDTFQCIQMAGLSCGCQQAAPMTDAGTTPSANVLHILSAGSCTGEASRWNFTDTVGLQGDFILRARAEVNESTCSCGARVCGEDGCGNSCGTCGDTELCRDGACVPDGCTPNCGNRECGSDGCDDVCGTCPGAAPFCQDGFCVADCETDCVGRECGDDGCGSDCGTCPAAAPVCNDDGLCEQGCVADCAGRECGDDGCGGDCGTCPAAAPVCNDDGLCEIVCVGDCTDRECGDDGCGGDCGTCPAAAPHCSADGLCSTEACQPACGAADCGDNGCGGSCGTCAAGQSCQSGVCQTGGTSSADDSAGGCAATGSTTGWTAVFALLALAMFSMARRRRTSALTRVR